MNLKHFMPMVDALAATFGRNCEVVLHDFSKPHKSIVKIVNSHITGRKIGDPATDLILSYISKNPKENCLVGYRTKTITGIELRSTTIFIRDNNNKIIGSLCINIDLTTYIAAKNIFDDLCTLPPDGSINGKHLYSEKFESDVDKLISELLDKSIRKIGKPIVHMTKGDKLTIISDLKSKGLFLIKGATKVVAERLNVSISTIYKYLEEV